MSEKMIKIMRPKNLDFVANYPLSDGRTQRFIWRASSVKKETVVEVPQYVFDWLSNGTAFKDGELVVLDEEAKEEIAYVLEEAKTIPTVKEVKAILEKPQKQFKAEIDKIKDDKDMVRYYISVAKEIGLESTGKQKLLSDVLGMPFDLVFNIEA